MNAALPLPLARHPVGLTAVIAMHVVLGWALLESLGHRLLDIELPPLRVDIVEEPRERPPPPPPPLDVPPPVAPPPSFMPMPEVRILRPPKPPPAITVQRVPPPAAPVAIAPTPAPAPVTPAPQPPTPPAPPVRPAPPPAPPVDLSRAPRMNVSQCTRPEYPRAARRAEVTGTTRIRFEIDISGRVVDARVLRSAGPSREHRLLDRAAVDALARCGFSGGLDAKGRPQGGFANVDFVWKLE